MKILQIGIMVVMMNKHVYTTNNPTRDCLLLFNDGGLIVKQSKIGSILESITNILIGCVFSFAAQLIWFPAIGKEFTITENLYTTVFFTAVSFARSYCIRRAFNGKSVYKSIKCKLNP